MGLPMYKSIIDSLRQMGCIPVIGVVPNSDSRLTKIDFGTEDLINYYKKELNISAVYMAEDISFLDKLKPDVIFYQSPFDLHIISRFSPEIVKEKSKIAYVSYGINMANLPFYHYGLPFYESCWKIFSESEHSPRMASAFLGEKFQELAPKIVIAGSPKIDYIAEKTAQLKSDKSFDHLWPRPKSDLISRIIWAPHWILKLPHSEDTGYSSFLLYKDFFLQYLKVNKNIDLVLRAHPLIWDELQAKGFMSMEDIRLYKQEFDALPNARLDLAQEEYGGLFITSDAMITDGISFFTEYPFEKPLLHTISSDKLLSVPEFNNYGIKIIENFYKAFSSNDIVNFIEKIVVGRKDDKRESRIKNLNQLILQKNTNGSFIAHYIKNAFSINPIKWLKNGFKDFFYVKKGNLSKTNIAHNFWKSRKNDTWNFQKLFPDRFEKQIQFLTNFSQNITTPSIVLDLGCANGDFSIFLAQNLKSNLHVDAIDLSWDLICAGQKGASELGLQNISFMNASLEDWLSWSNSKIYDHLLVLGLFTCIIDRELFKKASKILSLSIKKSGYMVLKDTLSDSKKDFVYKNDNYMAIYRSKKSYIKMFESNGFSLVKEELISDKQSGVGSYLFLMQKTTL